VWLVVAGGWEKDTDELVAEGKQLLGDRVRFLVRFPRERMPELYRAADLFVLCSLKEMMPIALLEAAASGLPCLVHKHPVMEWMIGPGGVAIDMTAGGALAAAMGSLLGDPARRRALGESARSHCIEHFGRDRVVDQILAYYEFVMQHDG
jgi:glycosyltransferase involved in cell wall biosynthesis